MFSALLRAVLFGIGVEIGRDIYQKLKESSVPAPIEPAPEDEEPGDAPPPPSEDATTSH